MAFVDDGSGTFFAPAALGGHTQIELDFIEGAASVRLGGDDLVGDSVADANNHGIENYYYNLLLFMAESSHFG